MGTHESVPALFQQRPILTQEHDRVFDVMRATSLTIPVFDACPSSRLRTVLIGPNIRFHQATSNTHLPGGSVLMIY